MDLVSCTEHDIAVYITPPGVVRPVAEAIVLYVLALSHNLVRKDRLVREGKWTESTKPLGREPRDRIIGSIGLGGIATRGGTSAQSHLDRLHSLPSIPMRTKTDAQELGVRMVSLEELLKTSDYVLVNCPLTAETKGLLGRREFL